MITDFPAIMRTIAREEKEVLFIAGEGYISSVTSINSDGNERAYLTVAYRLGTLGPSGFA